MKAQNPGRHLGLITGEVIMNNKELVFTKMHGAGNDFIIIDLRVYPCPTPIECQALSNRHTGVGCDMILGILLPVNSSAVVAFKIWCQNGKESSQCGNGIRCVAAWAIREKLARTSQFYVESPSGIHSVEVLSSGNLRVSMGQPNFYPPSIPIYGFIKEENTYKINIDDETSVYCGATSVGNPHAVIQVENISEARVQELGKSIQQSHFFPPQVNVGFSEIISRSAIKLRVYEFGVGETLACGSGACAAVAVLVKQGRLDREVTVFMPGGNLIISWDVETSELFLTGSATFSFKGSLPYAALQ